jgi:hypothetical protein
VLAPATGEGSAAWRAGAHPADPYYWRREADAYASGMLGDLPAGLRAPACYAVVDRAGSTALWLEDVGGGTEPSAWTDADYERIVHGLGRAQAAWASPHVLDASWLSRGWLRAYVDRHRDDAEFLHDPAALGRPALRRHLTDPVIAAGVRIDDERHALLDALGRLPRTVTHFDFSPSNVAVHGRDVVVIDWAFAGVDAVGFDPGTFAVDATLDFWLDPARLPDLVPRLADAYRAGLAEGGLELPAAVVRGALATAAVVKFGWILPALLRAEAEGRAQLNRRPMDEARPVWAAVVTWLAGEAELVSSAA